MVLRALGNPNSPFEDPYARTKEGKISMTSLSVTGGTKFNSGSKTYHAFTEPGTLQIATEGPAATSITCEYVILGGGGGGGTSGHGRGGGGGAGGYLTGTGLVINETQEVHVGAGGDKNADGSPSYLGSIVAYGGGKGGGGYGAGNPGGSSGGASGVYTGVTPNAVAYGLNPGTPAPVIANFPAYTPGTTQGHDGDKGWSGTPTIGEAQGGGGGGAGGDAPVVESPTAALIGYGGIGVQLPATFQLPTHPYGVPGPGPSAFWVGGGGGAGAGTAPGPGGGGGAPPQNSYSGGGAGGNWPGPPYDGNAGRANTGGGGGGGDNTSGWGGDNGGSGLVLIAYPTQKGITDGN